MSGDKAIESCTFVVRNVFGALDIAINTALKRIKGEEQRAVKAEEAQHMAAIAAAAAAATAAKKAERAAEPTITRQESTTVDPYFFPR